MVSLAAVQRHASAYRKHLKRTAAAAAAVVKADLLPRSAVPSPLGKPSLRHAPAEQKNVNGNAGSGATSDGDLGDVEALESPANGSPVLVSVKQASSQDPCMHNSRRAREPRCLQDARITTCLFKSAELFAPTLAHQSG